MKVLCEYNTYNEVLSSKIDLKEIGNIGYKHTITIGRIYTVIAISYWQDSHYYGKYPVLKIVDDNGYFDSVPLFMFKIIDDRPSKYWHIRFDEKRFVLQMWPESFYQEYYFDDLTDGVPEIEEDFDRISKLLEEEKYE